MRLPVRGFTLIELVLSVGLGVAIIGAVASAFRVASGIASATRSLSAENVVMRAGMITALNEADCWTWCDDPGDATRQKLRAWHPTNGRGLPFTPFPQRWPLEPDADPELHRGWDPDYCWPADDARTWFHGNMAERWASANTLYGHYEAFAHLRSRVTLDKTTAVSPAYGSCAPPHTWFMNQLDGLRDNLGFYGLCDYLPANAVFGSYGSANGVLPVVDQGWQGFWVWPVPFPFWTGYFNVGEGECMIPRGLYGNSNNASCVLIPGCADTSLANATTIELSDANVRQYRVGQLAKPADVQDMLAKALPKRALLPLAPASWPNARVSVLRMMGWKRFITSCRVRCDSAVTGERVELTFTTLSTTLRGARRQRRVSNDPASPAYDVDLDGGTISTACLVQAP